MKRSIKWAAIRTTNGEDWIDIHSLSNDKMDCQMKAHQMNQDIPAWAKDNPINSFEKVEIKLA